MQCNTELYFTVEFSVRIAPYTTITTNLAVALAVVQFLLKNILINTCQTIGSLLWKKLERFLPSSPPKKLWNTLDCVQKYVQEITSTA